MSKAPKHRDVSIEPDSGASIRFRRVIAYMLNTPPQPRATIKAKKPKAMRKRRKS